MAHYTSVDDGYDVELYKSFESLWKAASGAHRHTEYDEPLWLDANESVRLTKTALRKELASGPWVWIYESGQNDWTLKLQKH